jgi:alkanesulfonate monooxygenase SsuD/methylene tetrahydromethanopterin reductase-like flavin-dependent oxidoreductase (luciferase family)
VNGLGLEVAVWGERDPSRIVDAAERIDGKIDGLWIPETVGLDSVSVLGAVASRTKRIKIGAGILNVYTRSLELLAMTATSLQLLSKGRFRLGIGVSTPNILAEHGVRPDRPVSKLRLAVQHLRSKAEVNSSGASYPIYFGTIGEKLSGLAGELADGLILNCVTPEYAKKLANFAVQGARRAGRSPRDLEVKTALIFSLDPVKDWSAIVRRLAYYGASIAYNRMFRLSGFTAESENLAKAYSARDFRGAKAAISDRMVETFTVTPQNMSSVVDSYVSAGLTGIILVPVDFQEAINHLLKAGSSYG